MLLKTGNYLKFFREFHGSPVVRTLRFHCEGLPWTPGWGTKIPQAMQCSKIERKLVMKSFVIVAHLCSGCTVIYPMLLLLLSRFSRVRLCATPETAAHQAPPSLGFSRQEHWSVPRVKTIQLFKSQYHWKPLLPMKVIHPPDTSDGPGPFCSYDRRQGKGPDNRQEERGRRRASPASSFSLLFFFSWSLVGLWCCVSSGCSAAWFSYTYTYTFFFRFFSLIGYYKILRRVFCGTQ